MKLYIDAGRATNPRRVRIFLAEKGVSLPVQAVDLGAQVHKTAAFRAINPMQRLPALVLDDGTVIAESIAICRYIEALHPAAWRMGWAKPFGIMAMLTRAPGLDHFQMALAC